MTGSSEEITKKEIQLFAKFLLGKVLLDFVVIWFNLKEFSFIFLFLFKSKIRCLLLPYLTDKLDKQVDVSNTINKATAALCNISYY